MSEAKVSRRNNGRFYVDLRGLGGPRRSLGTKDARVAQARVDAAVDRLGGPTLKEAHARMMATHWRSMKAPPVPVYRAVALLLGADTRLGEITRGRLDDLVVRSYAAQVGPATINRRLAYLSYLLKDAEDRGEIERCPRMPRQKEPPGRRDQVVSAADELRILAHFAQHQPDMGRLVVVAIDTGMRLGELLRLAPGDIQGGVALVRIAKGGEARSVPLTARALAACQAGLWQAWTVGRVERYWRAMRAALGLPDSLVFHGLRHTCCSRLTAKGLDSRSIQVWMGHAHIATTTRYAQVNVEGLNRLRDALQ